LRALNRNILVIRFVSDRFLAYTAVASLLSALTGAALGQTPPTPQTGPASLRTNYSVMSAPLTTNQVAPDLKVEQLASNVFAFISNNTTHDWEDGNTTVIIGDDGVAVVDAPTAYLSKRHLAEIRKLTGKPVRYVINTHFHRDHLMGNQVYKDAFEDVKIVQQDYTALMADRRDPAAIEDLKGKQAGNFLQSLREKAETGVDAKGNVLTGYDLERAQRSYGEFLPVYNDAQTTRYVPADIIFDSSMTIKLGSREIQLIKMAGHTAGDTVVWLPKEGVLVTGDLVISPVPYGGYDQYNDWIASLNKLIAYRAAAIVPGHGEVQFTQEYMVLERDLFQSLMDQAVNAVSQRRSLEDFKQALDLSVFEAKLVHDDPELKWGWDNYFYGKTGALPARAYRIVHGDL
jgi:cyclase